MNDTKWRELLRLMYDSGEVQRVLIQLVTADEPSVLGPWPGTATSTDFFRDTWVDDFTAMGPFDYSDIEWVEFPATWTVPRGGLVSPRHVSQDLGALKVLIGTLGQFEIHEDPERLRVVGYQ